MTHTSTGQPEALRLADIVERLNVGVHSQAIAEEYSAAALELRRLNARVQELEVDNAHLKDAAWTAIDALESSQAQRVPLTYRQINSILHSVPEDDDDAEWMLTDAQLLKIIRAAEAAHGITQEKQG